MLPETLNVLKKVFIFYLPKGKLNRSFNYPNKSFTSPMEIGQSSFVYTQYKLCELKHRMY